MIDLRQIARALGGEVCGGQILAPGPGHSPTDRSMSVKPSGNGDFVVNSFAGDDPIVCKDYVRQRLGMPQWEPRKRSGNGRDGRGQDHVVATYIYRTETGEPYLRVQRTAAKRFWQQYWTGTVWQLGKPKGPKIPYRLPELVAADADATVYITEGEKDAKRLASLGLIATTNSEGADKWTPELNQWFRSRNVVILPDNDLPGLKHVEKVATNLHGVAKSVRVLELVKAWPACPAKGDISDWLAAGGTAAALAALVETLPEWMPAVSTAGDADGAGEADDAEIERLAKFSLLKYERERETAAKRLGVRTSILDKLVAAKRGGQDNGKQGHALSLHEPEPWSDPVDGASLIHNLSASIRGYVVMSNHAADAAALWVVHTYLLNSIAMSPRLAITSPEKNCGKTTLLDVLSNLVMRPLPTANATAAAIFRVVEMQRPTLLIDEADTFLADNQELRGILNSGHRQGGSVTRTVGEDFEPRSFSTYSACAIALIGKLPGTLADRSVAIELRRRRPDEAIEAFRLDRTSHLQQLACQAARWAQDNVDNTRAADPEMPPGIFNRVADNWRPLLAVADAAGGEWPQRARAALASIQAAAEDESLKVTLLADIRSIFVERGVDRLASADLVEPLIAIEGRQWAEWRRGRPITPNALARLLAPFGIVPNTIRMSHDRTAKGYQLAHFDDAFARYLGIQPSHRHNGCDSGTSNTFQSVTRTPDVTVGKCEKPNNDGLCYVVTDGMPGASESEATDCNDSPALGPPGDSLDGLL
jgi:hypothetical protein